MNRLSRYWKLLRTLPADELRVRRRRFVERRLRRRPGIRRLNLAPDPPSWSAFARALEVAPERLVTRLTEPDERRGPLFADLGKRARTVATSRPAECETLLARARDLLDGNYDLLGSGPSRPLRPDGGLDWHRDFRSGLDWPADLHHLDLPAVRGDGSDVKLPWELSRCQHLPLLGQARLLAPLLRSAPDAGKLPGRAAAAMRDQIDDWILSNPRGLGVNWACTMDVAIRAVNWIAALGLMRGAPELDDPFVRRLVRSLWVHGRHIRANLEIGGDGLTSNHYLSNVVGLWFLGCALPELVEAEEWRRYARGSLIEEIERQVLDDGVDFERSIPYHRLVAEMFLQAAIVARCAGEEMPGPYLDRLGRMLEFTAGYTRPDGSAPQWGDNDDGRLLPLSGYASHAPHDHRHLLDTGGIFLGRGDLAAAAAPGDVEALWLFDDGLQAGDQPAAGTDSRGFADAGYYVLRRDDLHAGIPCGPVGTRGLGNHTHNDLLSLCVWAGGEEWITDPGTGTYSADFALRNRLRSTAAHATLQLGDREQNLVGGGNGDLFRMDDRSRPRVEHWQSGADGARLVASHHGFGDETRPVSHRREVRFLADARAWSVVDRLAGGSLESAPRALIRYPLAPSIDPRVVPGDDWPETLLRRVEETVNGLAELDGERERAAILLRSPARRSFWIGLDLPRGAVVAIADGVYSPRYGVSVPNRVVTAEVDGGPGLCVVSVLWSPPDEGSR